MTVVFRVIMAVTTADFGGGSIAGARRKASPTAETNPKCESRVAEAARNPHDEPLVRRGAAFSRWIARGGAGEPRRSCFVLRHSSHALIPARGAKRPSALRPGVAAAPAQPCGPPHYIVPPLAIGIYELAKDRGRTAVETLKSWCQQQTFTTVWPSLQR